MIMDTLNADKDLNSGKIKFKKGVFSLAQLRAVSDYIFSRCSYYTGFRGCGVSDDTNTVQVDLITKKFTDEGQIQELENTIINDVRDNFNFKDKDLSKIISFRFTEEFHLV